MLLAKVETMWLASKVSFILLEIDLNAEVGDIIGKFMQKQPRLFLDFDSVSLKD
jgi:hypothetical protein